MSSTHEKFYEKWLFFLSLTYRVNNGKFMILFKFPDIDRRHMPITGSTLYLSISSSSKHLWTELCSANSFVEALGPSEMVFEDGAFGKRLDLWGHEGKVLMVRLAPSSRDTRQLSLYLPSVRRWLTIFFMQVRKRVHQNWPCWHPDVRCPASRTKEK